MDKSFNYKSLEGPLLITGASGFIGANLCLYFASKGAEVLALEGPNQRGWRFPTPAPFERARLDLTVASDVERLIQKTKPSVVIHCAAYGAYSCQRDPEKIYTVNFLGLRHLLRSIQRLSSLRAFIQTGTSSEYGQNCQAPKEEEATLPDSDYAVSKVAATALSQYYGKKLGLPVWVLRLYSVYGPLEESSRLIPTLLRHASERKLPPLVDAEISRDFVSIDDVAEAYDRLIAQATSLPKGEIYNIGSGKEITMRKLVSLVCRLFHLPEEPKWGSMRNRDWDHPHWYANATKAKRVLNWEARVSLEEGLQKTMGWMRQNPALAFVEAAKNSVIHDA